MKKTVLPILISIMTCSGTYAQIHSTKQRATKTTTMENQAASISFKEVSTFGYSEFVEIDLGSARMLVFSGQLSLDNEGNLIGAGDFSVQAEHIFSTIKDRLEKAGGSMKNIVKLNNFFVDLSDIQKYREIRNKFIDTKNPPAQTSVEINHLAIKGALLEVELTAVIPK